MPVHFHFAPSFGDFAFFIDDEGGTFNSPFLLPKDILFFVYAIRLGYFGR